MTTCWHGRVRRVGGCAGRDLETDEPIWQCLTCGEQGTMPELSVNRPLGVHAIEEVDRGELLRRYPLPPGIRELTADDAWVCECGGDVGPADHVDPEECIGHIQKELVRAHSAIKVLDEVIEECPTSAKP